jgi:uncharacterized phage protein (TIGR01671 family)
MRAIEYRQIIGDRVHYWGFIDGCFVGPITNQQSNPTHCQFTGLYDRNGVKIFEGDVVKWDDMSNGKYWRVAVVSLDPDLQFECIACPLVENHSAVGEVFEFANFIYTDTHNHLEVIGNTHQHRELLEGAA